MMTAVDGFKMIDDTHEHRVGGRTIKAKR